MSHEQSDDGRSAERAGAGRMVREATAEEVLSFAGPEEYAQWINERLGREVRRRRLALPLSAYMLAKDAMVSDQAILNLEQGLYKHGCLTGTLARIAWRLKTTPQALFGPGPGG